MVGYVFVHAPRGGVSGSLNFARSATGGVSSIATSANCHKEAHLATMKLDALHRFTQYCAATGITSPLQLRQCPVDPSNRYMTSPGPTVMTPTTPLVVTPLTECILGESAEDLAAKLLEKYEATQHSPYFDVLPPIGDPASFETLPHRWTDSQLAHAERLCDAGAVRRIHSERAEMAKHDERMQVANLHHCRHHHLHLHHRGCLPVPYIVSHPTPFPPPSLFQWALSCVSTRAVFLDFGKLALVPALDMINHSPAATGTSCVVTDDGNIQLSTTDACRQPEGSEVYIKYGENTNLDLLVDYGFCMAHGNTDDYAEVLLNVPTADGMIRSVTVRCRYEGGIDEPGLASLRAALCTEPSSQFLPSYVATSDRRPGTNRGLAAMAAFPRPISEENERAVWHALVEALTIAKCEAEGHASVHADGQAGAGMGADPVVGVVASYRTARAKVLGRALEKLRQTRPGDRINSMRASMMFAAK